jgi:Protein of unknown function (DUF4238)
MLPGWEKQAAPMAGPKRHHYLPQFYLQRFTRDGSLWVYDRLRRAFRQQQPVNTAVEGQRYTVELDDGTKSLQVEEMLAAMEGEAKVAIEKLEAKEELAKADREAVAWFIAFLVSRVPDFEDGFQGMTGTMLKQMLQMKFASKDAIEAHLLQHGPKDASGAPSIEDLHGFIKDGAFTITADHNQYLASMLGVAKVAAPLIYRMKWVVLHTWGSRAFVTSDRPFVILPPRDLPPAFGFGLATPGATKIVALGNHLCLLLGDPGDGRLQHREVSHKGVRAMNLNVVSRCYEYAFGRDQPLLQSLVERTGVDQSDPEPSISAD